MSKASALLAAAPLVLLAAPLAACVESSAPPLAQLTGVHLELDAAHDARLIDPGMPVATQLTISGQPGDCVELADDVTADLDGVRMRVVSRGGAWNDYGERGCDLAVFSLDQQLTTTGTSTLLVRDANTTWTISGADLFANDFALVDAPVAGTYAHLVWHSAQTVETPPYVQFERDSTVMFSTSTDVLWQGNVIEVGIPSNVTGDGTLSINAARAAQPTRCDGPASCDIRVAAGADLPTTIAPPNP